MLPLNSLNLDNFSSPVAGTTLCNFNLEKKGPSFKPTVKNKTNKEF